LTQTYGLKIIASIKLIDFANNMFKCDI
jgi:hypothetical protein